MHKARAGDFGFSKLLFEMEGKYPPSRKIKSEFIDKTENQKEKMIIERIENNLEFEKRLTES